MFWNKPDAQDYAFKVASEYLGLKEYPGAKHNKKIVQMFADSGHSWVQDDETPWCAAFVGSVLNQIGVQGSGKLNARSYLDWGEETDEPEKGDIVVYWRGSKDSWKGHVGFFAGWDGDNILTLGGNQGNRVSIKPYHKNRLLGFRTYK